MNVYVGYTSALYYWRDARRTPQSARKAAMTGCCKHVEQLRAFKLPVWLFGSAPVEVVVTKPGMRLECEGYRFHTCKLHMPRESFCDEGGGLYVAGPELCFLHMATVLSVAGLVMLGLELCGSYRLLPDGGFRSDCEPLTTSAKLARFIEAAVGFRGRSAAQRAVRHMVAGSASPRESALYVRLCLPSMLGGYGLPKPSLNGLLGLSEQQRALADRSCLYGDLLWPEHGVLVEYNGEQWHSGHDMLTRDALRANATTALGLKTFMVTADVYKRFELFDALARELGKALGVRQRGVSARQRMLRMALPGEVREQESLTWGAARSTFSE